MAKDFLSSQIRTGKIIGNGTPESDPKLVVYWDDNAEDSTGTYSTDLRSRVDALPDSTFIYIDGVPGSKALGTANTVSVFGGDVVIKGNLYVEGNEWSMWEIDPNDQDSLIPTNTIDGDTGLFAMNFESMIETDGTISLSNYTMTDRDFAIDKYFEFDSAGNVITKE
ncbi:hypothetical protein [Winogradskyella sp.]|uniref:hypothetical protein n=1 Tax=Winogradskyella sp. TaxID=1883156 RepID=UPI003F69E910